MQSQILLMIIFQLNLNCAEFSTSNVNSDHLHFLSPQPDISLHCQTKDYCTTW